MLLFCPACQAPFPNASRCPRCGGLLLMPHEVAPDKKPRTAAEAAPVRPTLVGRVLVGTALGIGGYLALRRLVIGAVLAVDSDPNQWWISSTGLIADQSLQGMAVVFGALIAGAGQSKGSTTGGIVAAVCGLLFLGYDLAGGADPKNLSLYLQPAVLVALGLLGGLLAAMVWSPPPQFILGLPGAGKLSSLQLNEVADSVRKRPTSWPRVLIGATVMVVGITVADDLRMNVQRYSGGLFHSSPREAHFITWQLALLLGLGGAMLAGADTGVGTRHGLYAGIVAGLGLYGLSAQRGIEHLFPPVKFWLTKLSVPLEAINAPETAAAIIASVVLLGIGGGWMGGALWQPIVPEHMRRTRRHGLD
jgi:hypothetical protein